VAAVRYRLSFPEPHTHLLHVEMEVEGVRAPASLAMPSWTPGSYLMREFPRNVQGFEAADGAGAPLSWSKTDKNRWLVPAPADGTLRVRYRVYANELSVRTSHLDASHASINGASVFLYPEDRAGDALDLTVEAPEGWRITTALRGADGRFTAASYDEAGRLAAGDRTHQLLEWEMEGKDAPLGDLGARQRGWRAPRHGHRAHRAGGEGSLRRAPYRDYTFIVHLTPGGSGGLEHRESPVCWRTAGPFAGSRTSASWRWWRTSSSICGTGSDPPRRARPLRLHGENYTRDLWVVEGVTTYYTDLLLRRAGLITSHRYLERLAEAIARFQSLPGRGVQSLADSSWDTWIKFYRPDANTPNSSISYYEKGALAALLLDLRIRTDTDNARSLDDVMRRLWTEFGARDVGFPEGEVERIAGEVAGTDLRAFFDLALRGTAELPFDEILSAAGLTLRPAHETAPAPFPAADPRTEVHTGLQFKPEGGRNLVSHVLAGTPAQRAGLNPGDELVALDGVRITPETLPVRLAERRAGSASPSPYSAATSW
jgi:predicted metalloprotease with PDZ domain